MKIQVDVLRVIQDLDIDTMRTRCAIVVDILGLVREIEVTEEEMEAFVAVATKARMRAAQAEAGVEEETFVETREQLNGPPSEGAPREPAPEKQFSIMGELGDPTTSAPEEQERDPGLGGIFDTEEDAEERQLREANRKKLVPRRTVPQDEAGNPVVNAAPGTDLPSGGGRPLPRMPADDDGGFAQG